MESMLKVAPNTRKALDPIIDAILAIINTPADQATLQAALRVLELGVEKKLGSVDHLTIKECSFVVNHAPPAPTESSINIQPSEWTEAEEGDDDDLA